MQYPKIDEFECPHYKCKDCVNFSFVIPSVEKTGCKKRFNHHLMEYAHPWFNSTPEENGNICSDFIPDGNYKAAMKYWFGIEHYLNWKKEQDKEFWGSKYHEKTEGFVGFEIRKHPKERYYVKWSDYFYNTMWEGNKLKAVYKKYYKQTRKNSLGYNLVTEDIDGVIVEGEKNAKSNGI